MAERKVLNKYFPPDFDPALIPKRESLQGKQIKVRVMLPMSIQCTVCGEYIGRGKKFNGRMEIVEGMKYLGITIFRFYVKCTNCCGEIAFRTDPQHADYILEQGAQRNFEPWRQAKQLDAEELEGKINAEEGDVMTQLENRTLESKREIDVVDALEEIKELTDKNETLSLEDVLRHQDDVKAKKQDELDEELAKEAKKALSQRSTMIKRIDQSTPNTLMTASLFDTSVKPKEEKATTNMVVAVKRKRKGSDKDKKKKKKHKKNKKAKTTKNEPVPKPKPKLENSGSLLCGYSSSDDSGPS